jgi:hypothetical protein
MFQVSRDRIRCSQLPQDNPLVGNDCHALPSSACHGRLSVPIEHVLQLFGNLKNHMLATAGTLVTAEAQPAGSKRQKQRKVSNKTAAAGICGFCVCMLSRNILLDLVITFSYTYPPMHIGTAAATNANASFCHLLLL